MLSGLPSLIQWLGVLFNQSDNSPLQSSIVVENGLQMSNCHRYISIKSDQLLTMIKLKGTLRSAW